MTAEKSELLSTLQRDSFGYFVHQTNPANGLVRDKSREGWPASIAAIGLALAAYPVGVECCFMTRDDAVQRTLATLRFFDNAPHGSESDATGHKGFYYHFLDMSSGRCATLLQHQYAIRNPREFEHYGDCCWGVTSSDGPGPTTVMVNGRKRAFYDYIARGAPFGPDDGTLAPWAVVASLPFAPEIVLPTIQNYERMQLKEAGQYGYKASFNPTFPAQPKHEYGWVSPYHFGINQGPIVLMIENHRSQLLWSLMRQCPYLVTGLRRAGFTGGWLE